MRKTKIIATIGPASRDPILLEQLLMAGLDCARLNFSHGTFKEHAEVISELRRLSKVHNRPLAILQDLGGTKLRLGQVRGNFRISVGEEVSLISDARSSSRDMLPFPHPHILGRLREGSLVYISDGTICLEVTAVLDSQVRARVTNGGIISSFKGVNLPGLEVDEPVLTEADKLAIRFGVEHGVDWLAVSFVRTAEDIREVKGYVAECEGSIPVIAKLEKAEAVENLDSILAEVDAVMVARGDLGIEIPMAKVPIVQKQVVRRASEVGKLSLIATQMLYSMTVSPTPTRAEVSDVSNAVLDGCDAILLSDETAVGNYPVEAVKVADTAIHEAEQIYYHYKDFTSYDRTQAIAGAAASLVQYLESQPIVVTSTGRAAFEVSRFRPNSNILVLSHDEAILRRVCLGWGLIPIGVIPPEKDAPHLVSLIIKAALASGLVTDDAVVTIVHGYLPGVSGTTNTLQVLDLKEYLSFSAMA